MYSPLGDQSIWVTPDTITVAIGSSDDFSKISISVDKAMASRFSCGCQAIAGEYTSSNAHNLSSSER
jgi:hypothetical protein